ncbi:MAG: SAM-dependent methyltransferase [Bacteroidales bacterium]|nr:SAM-dependent methyltransferase [Bacteroidales bacterium]
MESGTLFLIPVFLSDTNTNNIFPSVNLEIINSLNEFIVEDLRTARRFLRKVGYKKDFEKVNFHLLNKHTNPSEIYTFLDKAKIGHNIGLMSEAGIPCVADPGFEIVNLAHQLGIKVKPLIGPSSILQALMGSGFNGQQFVFHGYLPIDKKERRKAILNIEHNAKKSNQTQIFIETPYRNNKLVADILTFCAENTQLCIATDITGENEFIKTKFIHDWRKIKIDLHKKPTVFLINV